MSGETYTARFHDGNAWRCCLVIHKRATRLVYNDGAKVRAMTLPEPERRYLKPIDTKVATAKRLLRDQGRRFGITKEARRMIKGK